METPCGCSATNHADLTDKVAVLEAQRKAFNLLQYHMTKISAGIAKLHAMDLVNRDIKVCLFVCLFSHVAQAWLCVPAPACLHGSGWPTCWLHAPDSSLPSTLLL